LTSTFPVQPEYPTKASSSQTVGRLRSGGDQAVQ
jgi:hypothetical protein